MSGTTIGAGGVLFATWTTSGRPASPVAGQVGWNTTLGALDFYNGSTWYNIAINGPTCSVYQSSAQTGITTSTITKVNFQTALWDTASAFNTSTSVFTVPVAGYYQVNGSVSFSTSAGVGSNEIFSSIYQNGSETVRGTDVNLTLHYTNVGVSAVLKCAVNDTISLYVFQASGGNGALNAAALQTRMDITFIRAI